MTLRCRSPNETGWLPPRIFGALSLASEAAAGGQGFGVLRSERPLDDGQQCGCQVPGGGRITRLPGPDGEFVSGGKG
jgi:hypothetical protein